MKKFLLLTKTFFVVALLCIGATNAWGEDVYTTVYTRATVSAWAEADKTDWGGNSNLTIDANYGLFFNPTKPGSAYSASKTFTVHENAKIKYEVSWRVGSATGRDSNYEYIQFGDNIRISWNSNYYFYLDKTGTSTMTQQIGSKGSNTVYTKPITIIFDTSTKTVESFSFDGIDLSGYVTESFEGGFNSLTFGFQRGGSTSNWGYPNGIITITVSECEQEVTNVGYTINYKLGGNLVKSVSSEGVVDQVITADAAINGTEEGYVGNHYLITAANAPTMTLVENAASNVLDVSVRAPYKATLNVTTTVGTNDPVLVSTPLTETDSKVCTWSYAYPMYVLNSGSYYKADNTSTFGEGGEFTDGQVINKSVTYSDVDESVVFFQEAEASAGTNYSYSNGGTGYVASQNARDRGISVGTLPAGVYSFTANITAANRRSLGIRQSTNDFFASVGTSNEDLTTGVKSANFTLNAETSSLWINGANSGDTKTNQSEDFDYVLIKKLPDNVSKTITSAGWATYCSPYALDFSGVAGLTAYKVTGTESGSTLALETVTTVPANTGVLLEGTAGAYNIPVIASADAVSGNKLVGVIDSEVLTAEAGFVLMGSPQVGFYKNNNNFTLTANTAYLPADFASVSGPTRSAYFFGGDITGVANVEAAAEAVQKDGKFFKDGKLVIFKNGKKFNAAGAQVK